MCISVCNLACSFMLKIPLSFFVFDFSLILFYKRLLLFYFHYVYIYVTLWRFDFHKGIYH